MKFLPSKPKYEYGDAVLIEGSQLAIERVMTIKTCQIRFNVCNDVVTSKVWYEFKESQWMHEESSLIRKVEV